MISRVLSRIKRISPFKGIIAIGAMGKIAETLGQVDDAKNFTAIAKDYISKWVDLAMTYDGGLPHTKLAYQDPTSHGKYNFSFSSSQSRIPFSYPMMSRSSLTNIYADRLLDLNLVPAPVYEMQNDWYPTIAQKYGVPLDTRNFVTKCMSLFPLLPPFKIKPKKTNTRPPSSRLGNVDCSRSKPPHKKNVHL